MSDHNPRFNNPNLNSTNFPLMRYDDGSASSSSSLQPDHPPQSIESNVEPVTDKPALDPTLDNSQHDVNMESRPTNNAPARQHDIPKKPKVVVVPEDENARVTMTEEWMKEEMKKPFKKRKLPPLLPSTTPTSTPVEMNLSHAKPSSQRKVKRGLPPLPPRPPKIAKSNKMARVPAMPSERIPRLDRPEQQQSSRPPA